MRYFGFFISSGSSMITSVWKYAVSLERIEELFPAFTYLIILNKVDKILKFFTSYYRSRSYL